MSETVMGWLFGGWLFGRPEGRAATRRSAQVIDPDVVVDTLTTASVDDASLVARVRTGNPDAFSFVFHEHYRALHRYATHMTRNAAIAEELVADVFVQVWDQRARWTIRDSIRAHLFAAVRHRVLHWHRRDRLEASYASRVADELTLAIPVTVPPDGMTEWRDLVRVVRAAIQQLPPRTREAYVLHRQDGLTFAEIARVMGITPKTVEKQVGAALRSLRELLADVRT